ncbi:MAG: 4Fe-4S binding protein [Candidatus Ancaeobacter aquaticus]|nr:4Fe-4S binding protein [Candidatus Ancaeobacter aquaticus]
MPLFSMTKTTLKSLFKKPVTRKYPFGPLRTQYKNTRGTLCIDVSQCIFCGICEKKCPTQAISVIKEEKMWKINRLRCIICGSCVEHCPKKCLHLDNTYTKPGTGKMEDTYHHA